MSEELRPFSNGSEFMAWNEHNCCRCTKGPKADHQGPNEECLIENTFALASICAGRIDDADIVTPEETAKVCNALGWNGKGPIPDDCPQRIPLKNAES